MDGELETMEVRTVKFNFEEAKLLETLEPGQHVITKCGYPVRILSWEAFEKEPIVAVVGLDEHVTMYTREGYLARPIIPQSFGHNSMDLRMIPNVMPLTKSEQALYDVMKDSLTCSNYDEDYLRKYVIKNTPKIVKAVTEERGICVFTGTVQDYIETLKKVVGKHGAYINQTLTGLMSDLRHYLDSFEEEK